MRPTSVTVSSATTSNTIPVDWKQNPVSITLACIVNGGGTLTFKAQYTVDDIYDPTVTPTWLDHATITGASANVTGNIAFPVRAVRLNVTAYTSGSVTMTILQGTSQ